jgi:hypothetical protein
MTLQRKTGLVMLIFSVGCLVVQLIGRGLRHVPIFIFYDLFTIAAVFASSYIVILENKISKIIQVLILFVLGCAIMKINSVHMGTPVWCIAFLLSHAYGALRNYRKTKILALTIFGYAFLFISENPTTIGKWVSTFLIMSYQYVFISMAYFVFYDLLKKCQENESDKNAKLQKMESLCNQSISANKELLQIFADKRGSDE